MEVYKKFSDKFNKVLNKFASEKQKELDQYVKTVTTTIVAELEGLKSALQSELDAKKVELQYKAKAICDAVLASRLEEAKAIAHTYTDSRVIRVSNSDVTAEE